MYLYTDKIQNFTLYAVTLYNLKYMSYIYINIKMYKIN